MAKKIRPPFAWLGNYTRPVGLVVLGLVAAGFRFWQLGSLPPGLSTGEAHIGLDALALAQHGTWPGLTSLNGYAPLWIWLEALSVKVFGHTVLALRLWPALLGVAAVLVTWLWARSWFTDRVAWIAAFFAAVTPWAVTLSRNASPVALTLLLVPLSLWLASEATRRNQLRWWLGSGLAVAADLLNGPLGWLTAISVVVLAVIYAGKRPSVLKPVTARLAGAVAAGAGLLVLVISAVTSWNNLRHLPSAQHFTASLGAIGSSIGSTLVMFNLTGDANFQHNLSGEPLLNAFVGLMLIAGILVSLTRLRWRRYRVLLSLLLLFVLPAALSTATAPDAAHAAAVFPIVTILAAIGVSYMLELWYSTFPINSAARSTGQLAIIILLALTFFQGYTQYFRAWAGSGETYGAYNEAAVAAAGYLQPNLDPVKQYLVASDSEQPVAEYLTGRSQGYTPLSTVQLAALPLTPGRYLFVVTASARDDAAKDFSLKFPGGILRPHLSKFNQAELYYDYEVTK